MRFPPVPLVSLVLPAALALTAVPAPGLAGASAAIDPDEHGPVPTVELTPPPAPDGLGPVAGAPVAGALRYGSLVPVHVDPREAGLWTLDAQGRPRWALELRSAGARSVGLELADVALPPGGRLTVRAPGAAAAGDAPVAAGPEDVAPNGRLQLPPVPGEAVLVEYRGPEDGAAPRFRIETLIHDHRGVFELERALTRAVTASSGCTLDASCPEAAIGADQARAVVRTLSGGVLCSGTLINNSAQDGTPYVLTAWHCGQDETTLFRFGYADQDCGATPAPVDLELSGATVLAADQASDGRLLRIESAVPAGYGAFFAGWNRSTAAPTEAYALGHPDGGPLAAALAEDGATPVTLAVGGIGLLPCFRARWTLGSAVDGFSGGPLFDQSHRLRGATSGAPALDCPDEAYFGRFGAFYADAGLGAWLDPLGLGLEALHGFDPADPGGAFPPGAFQLDATDPAALEVVDPDQPITLSLLGVGFEAVDTIRVNGVALDEFPPAYTLVDDFRLDLTLVTPLAVGTLDVELEAAGQLASIQVPVDYNAEPTLDLDDSDPEFLLSFAGLTLTLAGQPGDIAGLYASTSPLPTSVPGIVELAIGDDGTILLPFGGFVIPASGHVQISGGFSGLATGTKLYFQALWIPAADPSFPLGTTNVEVGTVLF